MIYFSLVEEVVIFNSFCETILSRVKRKKDRNNYFLISKEDVKDFLGIVIASFRNKSSESNVSALKTKTGKKQIRYYLTYCKT
jgi:hypothetical protein